MTFYTSISDHYDDIFPLNPAQVDFVLNNFSNAEDFKLLDIGCGTGSLSITLAPHFNEIVGIDPDEMMLKLAVEKAGKDHDNLSFHPYGMLDLEKQFGSHRFDAILCFGNTLVHLRSAEQILDFLKQAKKSLKPGGKLLVQIINYTRIFEQQISDLPTIENDQIKFVRNYHYPASEQLLNFETILSIKSSGEVIRNCISLFPVRKDSLEKMLLETGFSNLSFYGNFKRDQFLSDSIPLVISADL